MNMYKSMSLRAFAMLAAMVLFSSVGSQVGARANPAVKSFNDTVLKAYNRGIRDINTAHKQRVKSVPRNIAAKKFTARYERTFVVKVKSMRKSAKTALAEGLRTSSLTVVKNRIKTFKKHIKALKNFEDQSGDIIDKMKREKKYWWRSNGKYFNGTRKMSSSQLKKLGLWVRVYGTPTRMFVVLDPKKGGPKSYPGAIRKEQAQLKKLSGELKRIIAAYKAGLKKLQARKAVLEAKLKHKTGKKPRAAPPPLAVDNDM